MCLLQSLQNTSILHIITQVAGRVIQKALGMIKSVNIVEIEFIDLGKWLHEQRLINTVSLNTILKDTTKQLAPSGAFFIAQSCHLYPLPVS